MKFLHVEDFVSGCEDVELINTNSWSDVSIKLSQNSKKMKLEENNEKF